MTNGTSQGLFIVVAIVIFGIFIGLSYTVFGSNGGLTTGLENLFKESMYTSGTAVSNRDYEKYYSKYTATDSKYFTFDIKTKTITNYDVVNGPLDVVIPKEINGTEVKYIGGEAFFKKGIESVVLPPTLIEIQNGGVKNNLYVGAFANNNLKKVIMPDTIKKVGWGAFHTNKITELKLSENLERLENYSFQNNFLKHVDVPDSVLSVGTCVFENNGMESIKLSKNQKDVGYSAYKNNKLTQIEIPDSVKKFSTETFRGNDLKELTIPKSTDVLLDYIILGNKNLKTINIPIHLKEQIEKSPNILALDSIGSEPIYPENIVYYE